MLTCLPLFLNLLSPRDTWWFQGLWVQLASSRAVLPSPSKPWTLNFYLFLVPARIRTKEVTQCFLGCHQLLPHQACLLSLLTLSTVQSSPASLCSNTQNHLVYSLPCSRPCGYLLPAQTLSLLVLRYAPGFSSQGWAQPPSFRLHCPVILFPTEIDRESDQANQQSVPWEQRSRDVDARELEAWAKGCIYLTV